MAWTVSEQKWVPYKHLLLLSNKLVDIAAGRIDRLLVFMPPQHGKSKLISHYFPAWYLGLNPDRRVVLASYEAEFAAYWGRQSRDLLERHGEELFTLKIRQDSRAVNNWTVAEHDGGMVTTGIGGPITGKTADLLIIDDPVKNADEAKSKVIRDQHWDWYQTAASTRLSENGAIILVMTRWNEDDLAGRILQQMAEGKEQWEVISLPALAEGNDPMNREIGDALCPELKSLAFLNRAKGRLTAYWWSALYQQHPTPDAGQYFERSWWQYYMEPISLEQAGEMDDVIMVADCTFTKTDTSDYVAIGLWGRKGPNAYLIHQIRGQMTFWETVDIMLDMRKKWPVINGIYVEKAANGEAVIETLQLMVPGVVGLSTRGGKESRAAATSPYVKSGSVYLPHETISPWVTSFVEECASFPNGTHDDQVDQTTHALMTMMPSAGPNEEAPTETEDEKFERVMRMVQTKYGTPVEETAFQFYE